jgi:Prenyltransferase and squalene oxidase repeat
MVQNRAGGSDNARMSASLFARAAPRLSAARSDGGFGPRPGMAAEPEPTALAAIALDDDEARGWLAGHQRPDGGFALVAGEVVSDAATALAAIALGPGTARERALDHVVAHQAQLLPSHPDSPHDPNLRGWGWTPDTFGWVEPTAHAVLALHVLRPSANGPLADGLAVLADRECVGGGWNYGNRVVLGVDLPPYAQTTAIALVALQGAEIQLFARGVNALDRLWRAERQGGLSLAISLAAFRLSDRPAADEVERALDAELERTGLLDDTVALAWTAIAAGPGLDVIRRPA